MILARRTLLKAAGGLIGAPAIIHSALAGCPGPGAMCQGVPGGGGHFVTNVIPGTPENNVTAAIGMEVLVGGLNITVTDLGRFKVGGNTGTLNIYLMVNNFGSNPPVLATASINLTPGTANTFVYASISPVVLTAEGVYIITCDESSPGNSWYDQSTTITTTAVASCTSGCYQLPDHTGTINSIGGVNTTFPLDFKYM